MAPLVNQGRSIALSRSIRKQRLDIDRIKPIRPMTKLARHGNGALLLEHIPNLVARLCSGIHARHNGVALLLLQLLL